jgi:long-chain acyl-CoA synthetase
VTCVIVQERDQHRLYEAFSAGVRSSNPVAVLDPTWPQSFRDKAVRQVQDAASRGEVHGSDLVVFSSGSTGRPRGIVRTVMSWQASVAPFSDISGITVTDTVWLTGSLCSSLFLYGAFHAGAVGAQMVFRDDDPASATALHCVPSQLPGLLRRAKAGELPLVRSVVVAGDRCGTTLKDQCLQSGWRVVEYYGAAELSFVAWRDDSGPMRPFAGVQTKLRQGVLWARSPYLARGYLSFAATGPLRRDPQGWATVQDLAREASGGFEVLGRGDSAVNSGGHTVVVEEVERVLRELPGVRDVAVLGMPHPYLGQLLTAVVVGPAADSTLRAAVAEMPAPARPRRWLHAAALPHTSGGKLARDALSDLAVSLSKQ